MNDIQYAGIQIKWYLVYVWMGTMRLSNIKNIVSNALFSHRSVDSTQKSRNSVKNGPAHTKCNHTNYQIELNFKRFCLYRLSTTNFWKKKVMQFISLFHSKNSNQKFISLFLKVTSHSTSDTYHRYELIHDTSQCYSCTLLSGIGECLSAFRLSIDSHTQSQFW